MKHSSHYVYSYLLTRYRNVYKGPYLPDISSTLSIRLTYFFALVFAIFASFRAFVATCSTSKVSNAQERGRAASFTFDDTRQTLPYTLHLREQNLRYLDNNFGDSCIVRDLENQIIYEVNAEIRG